jgi:hypothetical protein
MFKRLKSFIDRKNRQLNRIEEIHRHLNSSYKSQKINLGQIQIFLNSQRKGVTRLGDVEFQVFSQWGDDGIIQYLISKVDLPNKTFVEFGVENYTESNTRFLILNNNWSGLVIDGSQVNIDYIKADPISWACELHAECAFITRDNINSLICKAGFEREVGILSIDIDGNDYWIWDAIDCIEPVIVIAEYNSVFGKNTRWTVPYDAGFYRGDKHMSNLYYGASLGAFDSLAKKKGYSFVGSNSKGNNAYFIRNDKLGDLSAVSVSDGYVLSKFREAHVEGKWITGLDRIKMIEGMMVYDIDLNDTVKILAGGVQYK